MPISNLAYLDLKQLGGNCHDSTLSGLIKFTFATPRLRARNKGQTVLIILFTHTNQHKIKKPLIKTKHDKNEFT